jgi:hypothetical protein
VENYEVQKLREEFQKLIQKLELRITELQKSVKPKTSLKTKISHTIAGLTLIGVGINYSFTSLATAFLTSASLSLTSFAASFLGFATSFFGYMVAHKGLEGSWL